jgi:hypothetical protein
VKPPASHAQFPEIGVQLWIFKTRLIEYLTRFKSNSDISSLILRRHPVVDHTIFSSFSGEDIAGTVNFCVNNP